MQKERGLTTKEAEGRLLQYGLNEIKDISKTTYLKILLRQVRSNFIIYLLLAAMLISFFVGKTVTAYTILAVILMVIIVGFIQEYRAEKAMKALRNSNIKEPSEMPLNTGYPPSPSPLTKSPRILSESCLGFGSMWL